MLDLVMHQTTKFSWIVFFVLSWSGFSLGTLPKSVANGIRQNQSLEFKNVLKDVRPTHRELIIERYAELLLQSPVTAELEFKKDELIQFLRSEFITPLQGAESSPKKLKSANGRTKATQRDIEILVQQFKGQDRGNVVDINVLCGENAVELPLEIIDEKDKLALRLNGIGIPQTLSYTGEHNSHCLEVVFFRKSESALLSWIGTRAAACPISSFRAGECLLDASEQIAKALGRKSIDLIDESDIVCSKNRKPANLTRLKIYQEGKGWYEKKGYLPPGKVDSYRAKIAASISYPLSTLLNKLDNATSKESARILLSQKAVDFMQLDQEKTVAKFMSWLWDNDCTAYIELDRLLKNQSSEIEFPNIYTLPSYLNKELK